MSYDTEVNPKDASKAPSRGMKVLQNHSANINSNSHAVKIGHAGIGIEYTTQQKSAQIELANPHF